MIFVYSQMSVCANDLVSPSVMQLLIRSQQQINTLIQIINLNSLL